MMENIGFFLDGCRTLGMAPTDMFQTVDLYEEKNINQVIQWYVILSIVFTFVLILMVGVTVTAVFTLSAAFPEPSLDFLDLFWAPNRRIRTSATSLRISSSKLRLLFP